MRFWRDDLQAAFVLFPMSIAFGLGIASISGFPPMAGLVSAVVGMMALFLYGGSNIVICGAAAALAPILYGRSSMTLLACCIKPPFKRLKDYGITPCPSN